MQLALVVGQVVSTVRCDGLGKDRLLLVDFIDAQGQPSGVR
ncbi:MAG: ethanolamine utilization microcompartment protein EutN, partial [Rhodoferax sp.]|nr:ethanolamine utilization microcompartment protein EutN [Rhodoferax sp.]